MNPIWQLKKPLDAVIFDCDGTLSCIEGIDELAAENGVGDTVASLTADAMTSTGVNTVLYEERLCLVRPKLAQVEALAKQYFINRTPDIEAVIAIFQRLEKAVLVMSAGIQLSVELFAKRLGIPKTHVFAVDVQFDQNGDYLNFDRHSFLTHPGGKGQMAEHLHEQYPSILHIGDGVNDLDAKPYVTRFVGYGGVFYRESILRESDFYICSASMAPLLPLSLTASEVKRLTSSERALYDKGVTLIADSDVLMAEQ